MIIDAQRGLTATITYTPWPGKPGPSESIDYDPASGRAYYALTTGGYVYYSSITTYPDLAELERRGQRVITLDGLSGYISLDPSARRLYVARGDTLYVLDSETLNRIGQVRTDGWPPRIVAIDGDLGRLYAPRDDKLVVWTRQGAASPSPLPPQPAVLTNTVSAILPSPAFATDQTLLATVDGHLCRSTDGGRHWVRLRGGLPESDLYRFTVNAAFSPDYANDRAMFAGAYAGDTLGAGVYCSTDSGQTWTSCSDGLYDLRVYRIVVSPAFAQDRTLLAYAYTQQGHSVYRTANGGQAWQLTCARQAMVRLPYPSPKSSCRYARSCLSSSATIRASVSAQTTTARHGRISTRVGPSWISLSSTSCRPLGPGSYCLLLDSQRPVSLPGEYRYVVRLFAELFDRHDYTNSLSALAVATTGDGTHDLFAGLVGRRTASLCRPRTILGQS